MMAPVTVHIKFISGFSKVVHVYVKKAIVTSKFKVVCIFSADYQILALAEAPSPV